MIQAAARLLTRYRHVNWALADQAMVSGANFLTWVALARALGIEEFGRFALVWMVVLFVDGIQHSAISAPMISIGPKQNETERPSYYGAVFLHQAMFAAASATVVFGAIHLCAAIFPKWDLRSLAAPLSFVVLAGQSQDFLRRYFFTLGRPAIAFLIDGFRYLGQIAALYWIFFHLSLDSNGAGVALWTMATTSFVAVISASVFLRRISWSARSFRPILVRQWSFGKWFVAASLMQWVTGNILVIVSGGLVGTVAVGAIRASSSIVGLLNPLILGLQNVVPIRASAHYHQGSSAKLIEYLKNTHLYVFTVVFLFCLVIIVFSKTLMEIVYGSEFSEFSYVLVWAASTAMLQPLGLVLGAGIRATEKTSAFFLGNSCAAAFTLLSAFPLVYFFGVHGVMLGLLGGQVIEKLVWWWKFAAILRHHR